ncbi:MAG: MATE family efflux transporter [Lawsonibacter sp.]
MQKDNILGSMPIGQLVLHMSWPIMLSMLMQAVYNLVDSIYVTRVSEQAFLALSYAYPIQTLMIAFCVGTGVGFSAMLSRRLGEQKNEEANTVVVHGFLLFALCWIFFFLFGLFASRIYMHGCTTSQSVIAQGTDYLQICCCFSFGMCLQFPCERILQSTGHPAGFMIIQGSGALLNIILDPIFIFVFDLGVAGAAVATVIGQITGGIIGIFLVRHIRNQFHVTFRGFAFHSALMKEMCQIAAPAILMQSLSSAMSLGLNTILNLWSETAVWVLGVYFKLQSFVFMPVFSINNGLISIISYNYGAKNRRRVSGSIRFGMLTAVATAFLGLALLYLFASPLLLYCFKAGPEALQLGISSLRMTALSFPVAAVSIICSAAFQSLGRSSHSLWIALLRQIVFLLPIALLFVRICPLWTFSAFFWAEVLTCLVSLFLYRKIYLEKIVPLC